MNSGLETLLWLGPFAPDICGSSWKLVLTTMPWTWEEKQPKGGGKGSKGRSWNNNYGNNSWGNNNNYGNDANLASRAMRAIAQQHDDVKQFKSLITEVSGQAPSPAQNVSTAAASQDGTQNVAGSRGERFLVRLLDRAEGADKRSQENRENALFDGLIDGMLGAPQNVEGGNAARQQAPPAVQDRPRVQETPAAATPEEVAAAVADSVLPQVQTWVRQSHDQNRRNLEGLARNLDDRFHELEQGVEHGLRRALTPRGRPSGRRQEDEEGFGIEESSSGGPPPPPGGGHGGSGRGKGSGRGPPAFPRRGGGAEATGHGTTSHDHDQSGLSHRRRPRAADSFLDSSPVMGDNPTTEEASFFGEGVPGSERQYQRKSTCAWLSGGDEFEIPDDEDDATVFFPAPKRRQAESNTLFERADRRTRSPAMSEAGDQSPATPVVGLHEPLTPRGPKPTGAARAVAQIAGRNGAPGVARRLSRLPSNDKLGGDAGHTTVKQTPKEETRGQPPPRQQQSSRAAPSADDEATAMLTPLQCAGIAGQFGVSRLVKRPTAPVNKAIYLKTLKVLRDVRHWKAIAQTLGGLTNAQTAALARRDDAFARCLDFLPSDFL